MERGDRGGGLPLAGLGRGWEEEGTTRETGAWLGSGAVTSAQERKTWLASVHVGSVVCGGQWAGSEGTCTPAPATPLWLGHLGHVT